MGKKKKKSESFENVLCYFINYKFYGLKKTGVRVTRAFPVRKKLGSAFIVIFLKIFL